MKTVDPPTITRTGDTGIDKSKLHVETTSRAPVEGPFVVRVGDTGLDQSHIAIDARSYRRRTDDPFRYDPGETEPEPVFPRRASDLDRSFHAGHDCHFMEPVINFKKLHAEARCRFDQSVYALEQATFGHDCLFAADIVSLGPVHLERCRVAGSVLATRLRLATPGNIGGDVICDELDPGPDFEIPAGIQVDGTLLVRKTQTVRLGAKNLSPLTTIGVLQVAGDAVLNGPLQVGQVRASGRLTIHGPAKCDEIYGSDVHLIGDGIQIGYVSSRGLLSVTGEANVAILAVDGDMVVKGTLVTSRESVLIHSGRLELSGNLTLNGHEVGPHQLFTFGADHVVRPAQPDAPVKLVSLNLTHAILEAISSATSLTLKLG